MRLPALLIVGSIAAGCGGYASTSEDFRKSLTSGKPEEALKHVNAALEVGSAHDLPSDPGTDTPLLLLERATILQATGNYEQSSRDFQAADAKLEVLDYTSDTAGSIGKYLYSDDATVYRTPPYEKLLLNTLNLINYLVRSDLGGAKVEARRFRVNQKYLKDAEGDALSMLSLGSYLCGFVFEMDGRANEAMRYYAEAQESGGVPTLVDAAGRLQQRSGETDERLEKAIGVPPPLDGDDAQLGELLVIIQTGMAPFKYPERIPIGLAVVAATSPGPGARLSSSERNQANKFAAKGLLKWVNYPKLKRVRGRRASVRVAVDGRSILGGAALDVERRVIEYFESMEGSIMAAAIVRLISRAVAGELSQAVSDKAGSGGTVAFLVGLAVEGAMTAADTPDTRSWVTLPGSFHVARARVKAGRHRVEVQTGGRGQPKTVEVPAGGFVVLNFSDLR